MGVLKGMDKTGDDALMYFNIMRRNIVKSLTIPIDIAALFTFKQNKRKAHSATAGSCRADLYNCVPCYSIFSSHSSRQNIKQQRSQRPKAVTPSHMTFSSKMMPLHFLTLSSRSSTKRSIDFRTRCVVPQ